MKPIGLQFKNIEHNPFTNRSSGELLLVHQCTNCGKISYNRIAGDDDPLQIMKLLELSNQGSRTNIKLLTREDKKEVLNTLFGYENNFSI